MSQDHEPLDQEIGTPPRKDDGTEKTMAAFRAALSRMDADPQVTAHIRELAIAAQETLRARESQGLDELLRILLKDEAPTLATDPSIPLGERREAAAGAIHQADAGMIPLAVGDPRQVGDYRLLSRLGEGSMGPVYVGVSQDGGRVAIRILQHEYTRDQDFRRRFAREVAAARKVVGMYTAPVVDADPEAEPPWMAAAYIPGPSLAAAVNEHGPLGAAAVSVLAAALAKGLSDIHDHGIIHRDLKPANIIMAADGPRVIDFGMGTGKTITSALMTVGSPCYMSPEQLRATGIGIGPPSDVFSLGAVLAFAATGRGPFDAPEDSAVISWILTRPPDLSSIRPALRVVIRACLAKDPAERPTLGELIGYFSVSDTSVASISTIAHVSTERQRAAQGSSRNQRTALVDIAWPDTYQSTTATESSTDATMLRMRLGAQLRRLREAAGISAEQAGYEIRASRSKISRGESGRIKFKARDIEELLTLYGVVDERERAKVLVLAKQSRKPEWWTKYNDILPHWFEAYLGLESVATMIRSFESQFVPGLFQTEEYARAVTRLGHPTASEKDIERRVGLRLGRQEVLTRRQPPLVWAVIDEAVLRRPMGGAAVMRAQLARLVEVAQLPFVTLQVVPFAWGDRTGASGSFSILRFKERDLPDVVYMEQLTSAVYLNQHRDIQHYWGVVNQLSVAALPPANSIRFIEQVVKET